ncbi:hypothetical protein ACIRON_28650 [Nocardioides sp. NPDC101246]|uniref:hypothetical protein n=1 Tax=Nocardioides sp. NPDC101246 TaxID=3364336 RepID=UPI0037F7E019
MRWWLKARRIAPVLAPGLVTIVLALGLFADTDASLVSWTVSNQTVPLLTFAPLILAATLALSLDSRLPEAELTSTRRLPSLDMLLIVSAVSATLAAAWFAHQVTHADSTLVVGRNALFLTGLMLVARGFVGRGGIVVATGWVLIVILVGRRTPTEYFPWAVTGLPISTSRATTAAIAAFVLGVLMTYLTARKLP